MAEDKVLGKVTHYYDHIGVAVVKLDKGGNVKVGDKVKVKGHDQEFEQEVKSLQIDHKDVKSAKAGDDFGIKLDKPVKEGDCLCAV